MVDISKVALELMGKDDATAKRIIKKSTDEYFKLLEKIASDIYDSCIESFYASYTPKVYRRHRDPAGSNLYEANEMSFDNGYLAFKTEEDNLLKYGTAEDKRREVLDAVMSGMRGTTPRPSGWPRSWKKYCMYPNEFSEYGRYWKSTKNTMDDIFEEFSNNGLADTNVFFWEIVSKYI
jgi:hypothetical protein